MLILVIDDESSVRNFIKRVLEEAGHSVILMESGRQAASTAQRDHPDVLLTDIFMPDQDGLQTIRQVREKVPHLPVIAMSGGSVSVPGDYLALAKRLGAAAVLAKPFTRTELLAAIATATDLPKSS